MKQRILQVHSLREREFDNPAFELTGMDDFNDGGMNNNQQMQNQMQQNQQQLQQNIYEVWIMSYRTIWGIKKTSTK